MKPHELRVHAEKQSLEDKFGKLDTFIHSPSLNTVPPEDRRLLKMQHALMSLYIQVLDMRVDRFPAA